MRLATLCTLCALMFTSACMPHVGHGPRIQPGTTIYLNSSLAHAPELQSEQISVMPTISAGLNHGWVSESGPALSVGVQVPVLALPLMFLDGEVDRWLSALTGDVYIQPWRAAEGGIDFGIGSMISTGIAAPYFQLGRADDGGIYTTQMVAWTYGGLNRMMYWMPTFTRRTVLPESNRAVDFYLTGGIGWLHDPEPWQNDDRDWWVGAGVVLELRPRNREP